MIQWRWFVQRKHGTMPWARASATVAECHRQMDSIVPFYFICFFFFAHSSNKMYECLRIIRRFINERERVEMNLTDVTWPVARNQSIRHANIRWHLSIVHWAHQVRQNRHIWNNIFDDAWIRGCELCECVWRFFTDWGEEKNDMNRWNVHAQPILNK